jgi:hypothetical protein
VAGQLAQHRELRVARLELGDDSRDQHDRTTNSRRAGGRVLRAGSAEPTKRADRVRIVPRVRGTLIEAARAATRTRDTFLAAHHHRVRARRGANRASLAVAHALLVAVWRMLQTGEIDLDPGGDCYARRDRPAPPDGSSPGTSASVTQSRRKKRRGRFGADLLLTDDERRRIVSSKRGVAGSNPGVAALQAALVAVAPKRFHARGEPVAWRGIEPKRVPRFSFQRARSPKPSGSIMAPQATAAVWCLATGSRTAGALVGAR